MEFRPPLRPQCPLVGASGIVWFWACLWGPAKACLLPRQVCREEMLLVSL